MNSKYKVLLPVLIGISSVIFIVVCITGYFLFIAPNNDDEDLAVSKDVAETIDSETETITKEDLAASKDKEIVVSALAKAVGSNTFLSTISGTSYNEDAENFPNRPKVTMEQLYNISKATSDKGVVSSFELSLNDLSINGVKETEILDYFSSIGYDYRFDPTNRMARMNLYVGNESTDDFDTSILVDDNIVSLYLGKAFNGYISVDTTTITEDYLNSPLFQMMLEENEDFEFSEDDVVANLSFNCIDLISKFTKLRENFDDIFSPTGKNTTYLKDLYSSIKVKDTGKTEEFTVGDKSEKCTEYTVTIPKEAVLDYINKYELLIRDCLKKTIDEGYAIIYDTLDLPSDEYEEESQFLYEELEDDYLNDFEYELLRESIKDDFSFNAYIDDKGRLIAIRYSGAIDNDYYSEKVDFELVWHGEDHLYSIYDGYFSIDNDYSAISLKFNGTSIDNQDTFNIDLYENNRKEGSITTTTLWNGSAFDTTIKISIPEDVAVTDVTVNVNGSFISNDILIQLDIDELSIGTSPDVFVFSLDFHYKYGVLDECIEGFEGKEYMLFELSEKELEKLVEEIEEGLANTPFGFIL